MKRWLIAVLIALLAISAAAAQAKARTGAEFVFLDGNEFTVKTQDGTTWDYKKGGIVEGDVIPVGAVVTTGPRTQAELRLLPNKSVIKLSKGTTFKIERLAASDPQKANSFQVSVGKIRVIAAALTGDETFRVRSPSVVCGVRGTDFVFSVPASGRERLVVNKGIVDFSRLLAGVEDESSRVQVLAGMYSDALQDGAFKALKANESLLAEALGDMKFARIDEKEVPGQDSAAASSPTPAPSDSPAASEAPAVAEASPAPSASPAAGDVPAASAAPGSDTAVAAADNTDDTVPDAAADADKPASSEPKSNPIVDWLLNFLNADIGSVSIDGELWAKAVLQPTFKLGKFSTALYLPIIYHDDLFQPSTWYHPAGNDEWSFGTDKGWSTDTIGALKDAASDLVLKIKWAQFGDQNVDPFFVKAGSLPSITLGHGILMRDYANDAEFPARRRVGVDLGFGLNGSSKFGIEALTNDLADPEIFGARAAFRLGGKVSLGLSAVADLGPADELNVDGTDDVADSIGDPALTGLAIDLDIPILNSDAFVLKAFADVGAIVPVVRNDYTLGMETVESGFKGGILWNETDNLPQNYGAMAGIMGKIIKFIDYRLEFRYSTGNFSQNFFNKTYDANRGRLAAEYAVFLAYPDDGAFVDTMGVYGEGGFSLLNDKLSLSLGYLWPWSPEYGFDVDAQMGVLSKDQFRAMLSVKKGLIPFIDVYGFVSYERTGFASALRSGASSSDMLGILFDENTAFRGEIVVPVPKAPMLDLAFIFGTAVQRDSSGAIVYADEVTLKPRMVPVLTLETRLRF